MPTQTSPSIYNQGPHTFSFDRAKFHQTNREKLLTSLRAKLPQDKLNGIVLLQGGKPFMMYDTDKELIFQQESYFRYLFGVETPDWFGAIVISTGKSVLFMPRLPDAYLVWFGHVNSPKQNQEKYGVDEVWYVDEMVQELRNMGEGTIWGYSGLLLLNQGKNTDSGCDCSPADFNGIKDEFKLDYADLHPILSDCRVRKSNYEVELMRYCGRVGSMGHVKAMQACGPDQMEYTLEAEFKYYCYKHGGCRLDPYTPICGSGPNSAVLHYGHAGAPNDRQMKDGDIVLCDMGCQNYRYGSDITISYPVNGKFTEQQKLVYLAVLDAQRSVLSAIKPAISWPDMHRLAEQRILTHLSQGGLLQGNIEDMISARLGALFMPHGLGHLIGIDTHDVAGYHKDHPPRIMMDGLKSLRTARVLQEGMVITVEPGCYFIPVLLKPAFENATFAQFLIKDAILPFMEFGGVRLEDDVLVTATGSEPLSCVPRDIEDVERVMAGGEWMFEEEVAKRKAKYGY